MTIEPRTKVSGLRLLAFMAVNCLGLNLAVDLAARWITHRSWHGIYFLDSNFHELARFFMRKQLHDSWDPMLAALHFWQLHPGSSLYRGIFFTGHIKFQYPLASLLPFVLLSRIGLTDPQIIRLAGVACWISVGVMAWLAILLARRSAGLASSSLNIKDNRKLDLPEILAIVMGTLFFFPLLKGCVLGQVQTLLTLSFAAGFYLWLRGKEKLAGAIIGLMALIKPQYALLLIWMALRKRWGGLVAGTLCVAIGVTISVVIFGWQNNLAYLDVMRSLSRHGESFFANQSMNGLLNRFLFNGTNLTWQKDELPPFRWAVYGGTLLSTGLLLGFAFFFPWNRARRGGAADFATMAVAATAASPVAWEHHYGILLPIFVWLWFSEYKRRSEARGVVLLASAYVLTSDCLSPVNLVWHLPVLNVLQSYLYFGALIVLCCLVFGAVPARCGNRETPTMEAN